MSNIRELCKDASFNRLCSWNNITKSKLNNVISNLGINNDYMILFYDSTIFENGKNGLAICESGIYWKDSFCAPRYLNWNGLRKTKLTYDDTHIYFGEKGSFFIYQSEVEQLVNLLHTLRVNVKIENIVEKTTGILGFVRGAIDFINELDTTLNNNDNTSNEQNEQPLLDDTSRVECNSQIVDVDNFVEVEEEIKEWTIAGKDLKIGPYTTGEVRAWLTNNQGTYDKLYVWKKGMSNWESYG